MYILFICVKSCFGWILLFIKENPAWPATYIFSKSARHKQPLLKMFKDKG